MSLWGSFKRRLKRIRSKHRSSNDGGPATPAPLAGQQQTLSTSIVLATLTNDGEHVIQPSAPPATPHIPAQLDRDDDVVRDEPDHDNDRSCSEQVANTLGEQAPATPDENEQVQESRSLWTQSYYNLDPGLVKEYNELLTKAFCETDSLPDDVTAHAIGTSADIAGYNTATLTGPSVELAAEIEAGQWRMHDTFKETYPDYIQGIAKHGEGLRESKKMRFHIGHHEVILRDWIAKAANLVLWGKPLVDEAVKPSSEASLVWAGVCLILPLLTNRILAEDAQRSGFNYVTARMEFYLALEPYLHQKSASVDITEDLRRVLEKDIMNLYQLILELQFKSVIRLYGRWWGRIVQDTTNPAQWGEMVSGVKEAERILDADLQKVSNLRKTDYLETLSQRAKTLSDTMNQLVSGLRLTQEEQVEQQKLTNKLLGEINLPIVPDALHDTLKDGHVCLEHTRTSVLKRIREWADYEESPTILWLNGPAGTGKSTIARTIAYVFSDQDQLGGSYFFDQNSGRTGLERFFPTIANRLVATIPGFGDRLRRSLEELGNPKEEAKNITTKAIEEQFKRLIKNPLAELPPSHPNTLERIIVVDALDECADRTRIQLICRLFAQLHGLPAIRIRVLLTSRPDPYIETSLQESYYYGLSLLDANLGHEAKQDILLFLQSRFKDIRRNFGIKEDPWPDQDDSVRLFNMATQPSPLFIYAETLYRFVKNGQRHPKAQLTLWLSQSDGNISQLNRTYTPILRQLLHYHDDHDDKLRPIDEEEKSNLRMVLGSIILLTIPLSAEQLARLLRMDLDIVNGWLGKLHAVLDRPKDDKIEILHKSFSDFVLGPECTDTEGLGLDESEVHARLASACVNRMKCNLRKDICRLGNWTIEMGHIKPSEISAAVPPDLEYACLNWVYHLVQCRQGGTDGYLARYHLTNSHIYDFLREHLLHWVEALSFIGKVPEGIIMMKSLQEIEQSRPNDLQPLAHDVERFLLAHMSTIASFPLQVYSSALVFSPQKSIVRNLFQDEIRWIKVLSGLKDSWGLKLRSFEGGGGAIRNMVFSPCGSELISWDSDDSNEFGVRKTTIQIWDVTTGQAKTAFESPYEYSYKAFSPHSSRLAMVMPTGVIQVWDVRTGQLDRQFKEHSAPIECLVFSSDGTKLASWDSDGKLVVCEVVEGEDKYVLHGPPCISTHLIISPDNSHLAGTSGRDIWIWDRAICQVNAKISTESVQKLVFSPDGRSLASYRLDTIHLWDVLTGEALKTFNSDRDIFKTVVFSPDQETLISGSFQGRLEVWNVKTGQHIRFLPGYQESSEPISTILFSANGTKLATATEIGIIHLWNVSTWEPEITLEVDTRGDIPMAISPDQKKFASAVMATITLWDITTEPQKQRIERQAYFMSAIELSPNRGSLASISTNRVFLWDVTKGTFRFLERPLSVREYARFVVFSPDGERLASAFGLSAFIWNTLTGKIEHRLESDNPITIGAFSPDSLILATGGVRSVCLWNINTGRCERIMTDFTDIVGRLMFSPDGELIAALSDEEVFLWSITTDGPCRKLADDGLVMVFSPDGTKLATGAESGEVRVWDVKTGKSIHKFQGPELWAFDLAFSPRGDEIAAGSLRAQSVICDIRTGQVRSGWYRGFIGTPFPEQGVDADEMPAGLYADFDNDSSWLTQGGKPVLYLPEDHRPPPNPVDNRFSLKGTVIALTRYIGGVTIISLNKPAFN